jgi:hypothetical protein
MVYDNAGGQVSGRRATRVPIDTDAIAVLGGELIPCRTLNLSVSGLALAAPVRRGTGRPVRVDFFLSEIFGWVSVDALLVRDEVHKGGFLWGVSFLDLGQHLTECFTSHVNQSLASSSGGGEAA